MIVELASTVFQEVDVDSSGEIDPSELQLLMRRLSSKMGGQWTHNWDSVMRRFDGDSSGKLDFKEFLRLIIREPFVSLLPPAGIHHLKAMLDSVGSGPKLLLNDHARAVLTRPFDRIGKSNAASHRMSGAISQWRRKSGDNSYVNMQMKLESLKDDFNQAHCARAEAEASNVELQLSLDNLEVKLRHALKENKAFRAKNTELQFRLDSLEEDLNHGHTASVEVEAASAILQKRLEEEIKQAHRVNMELENANTELSLMVSKLETDLKQAHKASAEVESVNVDMQRRLEDDLKRASAANGDIESLYKEMNARLEERLAKACDTRDKVEKTKVEVQFQLECAEEDLRRKQIECDNNIKIQSDLKAAAIERSSAEAAVHTLCCLTVLSVLCLRVLIVCLKLRLCLIWQALQEASELRAKLYKQTKTTDLNHNAMQESSHLANIQAAKLKKQLTAQEEATATAEKNCHGYATGKCLDFRDSIPIGDIAWLQGCFS